MDNQNNFNMSQGPFVNDVMLILRLIDPLSTFVTLFCPKPYVLVPQKDQSPSPSLGDIIYSSINNYNLLYLQKCWYEDQLLLRPISRYKKLGCNIYERNARLSQLGNLFNNAEHIAGAINKSKKSLHAIKLIAKYMNNNETKQIFSNFLRCEKDLNQHKTIIFSTELTF